MSETQPGTSPPAAVLLVSEDPHHRRLVEEALREGGLGPLALASSEAEALRALEEGEADILLLAPGPASPDAAGLCRQARGADGGRAVRVLVIVRPQELRSLETLLETGADDFLVEPFSPDELRLRLLSAAAGRANRAARGPAAAQLRQRTEIRRLRRALEATRTRLGELERSNGELRRLASIDALTGLNNRRSLFLRMEMEIDRSLRLNVPLCGILVDMDNFKSINDRYGHPCGDRVLREFGEKLLRNLRKYDFAGRYGGEEFFIILPNTVARTGLRIAERFRGELEQTLFEYGTARIRITLSLGVAQFQQGESREDWIARADAALYRAKQEGRNRTFLG